MRGQVEKRSEGALAVIAGICLLLAGAAAGLAAAVLLFLTGGPPPRERCTVWRSWTAGWPAMC